jgi:hypothetical protein
MNFMGASNGNLFRFQDTNGADLQTTATYRDVSAWYHVVVACDTTQATASNRVRIYVNGVEVTAFSTSTYPTQNTDTTINSTFEHRLGAQPVYGDHFNGYMTEVNFIDGQALTPSSFGEINTDTGVWQPKRYAGSYGTNGFYLNFSNNSNTTAATLGADYSGNGNNWTPNNFSVTAGSGNDSLVDVPTNWGVDTGVGGTVRGNYCTWNPLTLTNNYTITNGNLDLVDGGGSAPVALSTIAVSSGKWYWEVELGNSSAYVGFATVESRSFVAYLGAVAGQSIYNVGSPGSSWANGSAYNYSTASSATTGDIIGVSLNFDTDTVIFYKNGISQGTFSSGLLAGNTIAPAFKSNASTSAKFNFGQRPFAYTAPSGFRALNTQNLPTPTIGATPATQANKYFDVVLRNGGAPSGGTYSTTVNMANGALLWDKTRNSASSNYLVDSVRGISKNLRSNTTDAEATDASWFTGFNNGSFNTGSNDWGSSTTVVDWIWAANGAGVTNTAGTITSTVSANTTSGFSVVRWTQPGSGTYTIGHGLGAAPAMILMKSMTNTNNWAVYHRSLSFTQYGVLNTTDGFVSDSSVWVAAPTSSVFSQLVNYGTGGTSVAYCFAEVPGYSRFGSYTGNASTDGPFVFCGFRPAWVLVKRSNGADDWHVFDDQRDGFNALNDPLYPNGSFAEGSGFTYVDLLSNGFKCRNNSFINNNGVPYIFAAFAEAPQKFSLAR